MEEATIQRGRKWEKYSKPQRNQLEMERATIQRGRKREKYSKPCGIIKEYDRKM